MKFHLIAVAAACAAACASASAATTYTFRLAGSSALQKVVAQAITNNCTSVATLKGKKGTNAAGPLDSSDGQSQTLYQCTNVKSSSTWGSTYVGNNINIFVNTQGSAYGVFPVAYSIGTSFIDPATCVASLCTGVISTVAPDAGLSDLEPAAFNALVNHPVDPTVGGLYYVNGQPGAPAGTAFPRLFTQYTKVGTGSFASSKIAAAQTFGLAVSDQLLADLQTDQGLTSSQIPTVSSAAFATIYAPGYSGFAGNWQPLFTGALANASSVQNNQVNICSRLPGSGTLASALAFFLQAPFSSTAQAFATAANDNTGNDSTISSTIGQNNQNTYEIGEYDNSGAVVNCVATASAYAIGLLSTDRAEGNVAPFDNVTTAGVTTPTPQHFTFVNLDGSVPNTSASSVGKYQWVYEAYYNINANATDSAFAVAFGNSFRAPANITALGAPSTYGVMAAVPYCTLPYTGNSASCSHVSRNGLSSASLQYQQ